MSEFRWLLLAVGILVLAVVFWWSRREASGKPMLPRMPLARVVPSMASSVSTVEQESAHMRPAPVGLAAQMPERIITVRLTAHNSGTFPGEALVLALRDAGLRHGRFGIFHRHAPTDESVIIFSVASLVEPGAFDLSRVKHERYPGVSLFLALPCGGDNVSAFDDMMATARKLAIGLDGELLDDKGSRLSVQRERYLREEVIQFQHRAPPS